MRYIALRQKEGAFRRMDPGTAIDFSVGIAVHFAMCSHLFGLRKPSLADNKIANEIVTFILAGLRKKDGKAKGGNE